VETRDRGGRFLKGNPGGPGNPRGSKVDELRRAALEATSPAKVSALMRRLYLIGMRAEDEATSVAAIKLYLERTVGKAPLEVTVHARYEEFRELLVRYNQDPVIRSRLDELGAGPPP
jgi:hypothetical protein